MAVMGRDLLWLCKTETAGSEKLCRRSCPRNDLARMYKYAEQVDNIAVITSHTATFTVGSDNRLT